MNIRKVDLNLLVYLNVLLEECNVSRAAEKLALTQPTLSSALKRLRELFDDPLLVRTSEGMTLTAKAAKLKPELVTFLAMAEQITQPDKDFSPETSEMTFRIVTNDYIEAALIAPFTLSLLDSAPGICIDVLPSGDVTLADMEKGAVDLAINRFVQMPKSFHQSTLWRDNFCCLVHEQHPFKQNPTLEEYLNAEHIWLNRSGWGTEGTVSHRAAVQRLGWVDEALWQLDKSRRIRLFTRHYNLAPFLTAKPHLIATIPRRLAMTYEHIPGLTIAPVPFQIVPIEIKMLWSPLLHHSKAHRWLRRSLLDFAANVRDR